MLDKHSPFRHIPDTDAFVFRIAEDQFLPRVKDSTRDVVVMAPACVNLPGLRF